MKKRVKAPFFEIGPKSYLYGDKVFSLAMAAERAANRYQVDVLFTAPFTGIRRISEAVNRVIVLAPHMDAIRPGRGVASILPEALKAAGTQGVLLNHCEKPLNFGRLVETVQRADELELMTVVCAGSLREAVAVAGLSPDVMIVEPPELVGTGKAASSDVISQVVRTIRSVSPETLVLTAAGVSNGQDVYQNILAGADGTGASSGIACAEDPEGMVEEMVRALRSAYDERALKTCRIS